MRSGNSWTLTSWKLKDYLRNKDLDCWNGYLIDFVLEIHNLFKLCHLSFDFGRTIKTYVRENSWLKEVRRREKSVIAKAPDKRFKDPGWLLCYDHSLTCCIFRPRASLVTRLASVSSLQPSLITTESRGGLRGSGEVFVTSSRGVTLIHQCYCYDVWNTCTQNSEYF